MSGGGVHRIDPAEDAEQVKLPRRLRVVYVVDEEGEPSGDRFHVEGEDGRPKCDRGNMGEGVAATTVEEAREELRGAHGLGLTACRKCFQPGPPSELPAEVCVSIGTQAVVFHEVGHDGRPTCRYWRSGPSPRKGTVFATVDRERAEERLRPCSACFPGLIDVDDLCPLCGEGVEDRGVLWKHLPDCPAAEFIGTGDSDEVLVP